MSSFFLKKLFLYRFESYDPQQITHSGHVMQKMGRRFAILHRSVKIYFCKQGLSTSWGEVISVLHIVNVILSCQFKFLSVQAEFFNLFFNVQIKCLSSDIAILFLGAQNVILWTFPVMNWGHRIMHKCIVIYIGYFLHFTACKIINQKFC